MKIGEDIKPMDFVQGAIEGIVSQIPCIGAFAQAVECVKGNILQRRYIKWKELVEERLVTLEEDARKNLGDNDSFATTLLKATELAAQTNTIKSVYLANAVKYAASYQIDEDSLILMLNDIGKYTTSHFKVLVYLQNPAKYKTGVYFTGSIMTYFEATYPDFERNREELILNDLYRDGLVNTNSDSMVSSSGMESKRTTDLGDLFIAFFGIKKEDYE